MTALVPLTFSSRVQKRSKSNEGEVWSALHICLGARSPLAPAASGSKGRLRHDGDKVQLLRPGDGERLMI
jgi:hypothetical protein